MVANMAATGGAEIADGCGGRGVCIASAGGEEGGRGDEYGLGSIRERRMEAAE